MLLPRRRLLLAALSGLGMVRVRAGEVEKERAREPASVTLESRTLRYEAVHWGRALGLGQNGGYVLAREQASRRVVWLHRVYAVGDGDGKEGDKQDVFITAMSLEDSGRALRVDNERGEAYRFDLRTFQSQRLWR